MKNKKKIRIKKTKRIRKSKRNKSPARLGTSGGAKGRWTTTG